METGFYNSRIELKVAEPSNKWVRDSNHLLKLLTFQLSNYREFEIVKYAFANWGFWLQIWLLNLIDVFKTLLYIYSYVVLQGLLGQRHWQRFWHCSNFFQFLHFIIAQAFQIPIVCCMAKVKSMKAIIQLEITKPCTRKRCRSTFFSCALLIT